MILVADHDASFLELAGTILNRDRQVFLALDAQQAFQLAEHLGFTVALVDLDLRGKDGLSLIEKLRKSFPDLPVIAISSVLSGHRLDEAVGLGVVEVLHKPITPDWKLVGGTDSGKTARTDFNIAAIRQAIGRGRKRGRCRRTPGSRNRTRDQYNHQSSAQARP